MTKKIKLLLERIVYAKNSDIDSIKADALKMLLELEIKPLATPKQAASVIGRIGGLSTSEAKSEAARLNGLKGGRPKKKV